MTASLRRCVLIVLTAVTGLVAVPAAVSAGEPGDLTDATLAVTPDTDLVDFQRVTVTARDFDPVGSTLYMAQCASAVTGSVSIDDCDRGNLGIVTVPEGGDVELTFTVRREINTTRSGLVDCALPPGCVIGAATLGGDLVTVVEAAVAVTSFDPDVPAVPRLSIDVDVVSASASAFTARITCNRDAQASIDGSLTQIRGRQEAGSYGYAGGSVQCGVTPREVFVPLAPGFGRFSPGDATLYVFASAYDGFESAGGSSEFVVELRGATNKVDPIEQPGEFISVSIIGSSGSGTNASIDFEVVCSIPMSDVFVSFDVSQYAGRQLVRAAGYDELAECDGSQIVSVPIYRSYSGTIVGGPARVGVMVYGYSGTNEFFDAAAAVDLVRLRGRVPVALPDVELVEGTYISIDASSTSAIAGTVTCDEPLTVYLEASTYQIRGRASFQAYGDVEIPCDGATTFSIPISGQTRVGSAITFVYGYAYRIVDDPELPYDVFEYVWDDFVTSGNRLRR